MMELSSSPSSRQLNASAFLREVSIDQMEEGVRRRNDSILAGSWS